MAVPEHTHFASDILISRQGRLIGRSQKNFSGAAEEITLGTNLFMSGRVLNAIGGSGGGGGVPTTRAINTTAPLSGGGDLSVDRTLAVADASTSAKGVVELATDGESAAGVVVQGNDARMSNARTPTAHSHPESDITNLVTDLTAKAPTSRAINTTAPLTGGGDLSADRTLAISDATTTTKGAVELATSGENAANVVVQGNDARLSDARTPTPHSHIESDLILNDNTTNNVATTRHGFCPKLPNNAALYLDGSGAYSTPAGSAGTDPPQGSYAPGSYTIATGKFRLAVQRQSFTSAQRLTVQGTARMRLLN